MSRLVLALLAVAAAAGCSGPGPRPVEGELDAGMVETGQSTVRVTGRVRPASATVSLADRSGRRFARGNVAPDGRFALLVPGVPAGSSRFTVTAAQRGRPAWTGTVRIRRSPGTARAAELPVPARDTTPPAAALELDDGWRTITSLAPVRADGDPPFRLTSPRLRLVATTTDADGGTGRIRVSLVYERRCPGGAVRRRTLNLPPSQIAGVRLAPGARAPAQRRRVARVRLDPGGPGCVARGLAWADATNASGLETFSDQIPFVLTG